MTALQGPAVALPLSAPLRLALRLFRQAGAVFVVNTLWRT